MLRALVCILQDAYANRNERPFFQRVAKSCSVNHRGRGYRQLISTLERSSFRLVISPMSDLLREVKIRFRRHFFLPIFLCPQRKWRYNFSGSPPRACGQDIF